MPVRSARYLAIAELREIERRGSHEQSDANLERFLECPELQNASALIGRASAAFQRRYHTAFTGVTHTPLLPPSDWLPPPI